MTQHRDAVSRLHLIGRHYNRTPSASGVLAIPCPVHQGDSPKLELRPGDHGSIRATCYSRGCSYRDIAAAIERATGVRLRPQGLSLPYPQRPPMPPVTPRTQPERTQPEAQPDTREWAKHSWATARTVPEDNPVHPVRLWLSQRNLWPPEAPLPEFLRWRPTPPRWMPTAAGCLVVLAAPPQAWIDCWPRTPEPQAVQRIAIGPSGENRSGNKKSLGSMQGAVTIFGDPRPDHTPAQFIVCEGVADALALASREHSGIIATLGTGTMTASTDLARLLARNPHGAEIYADRDEGKHGLAPAGLKAARTLARAVEGYGGTATVSHAAHPHKDPADAAAHTPFTTQGGAR